MNPFTQRLKLASSVFFICLSTLNLHAQSGNVLDFDGINDYIEVPYNSQVSDNTQSVQLWVRVNSNTGGYQSIITSGGNNRGWKIIAYPDGKWYLLVSKGSAFVTIQGSAINYGVWTNIAIVYDQTSVRLYVNGNVVNTVAVSGLTPNPSSLPTRIGAGNSEGSPTDFFSGQIDEISLWTKVLSPSDVISNMNNQLIGNESGLVGYYNFNEGIANGNNTTPPINNLNDLSKYNMDGSLNNFTLNGNSSNWISLSTVPVTLVSFAGSKKDGYNLLEWSTASEQNTREFEIQRSEDGNTFNAIGTVNAAGNSDRVLNYQYDDRSLAAAPVYYYRLKMVDLDGATKYSSIISIKNAATNMASVYPNPARDRITINVADKSLLNTNAVLTDLNGKVMQRISITQTSTPVNVSSYMRGMYLLKFSDGSSIKIVKE